MTASALLFCTGFTLVCCFIAWHAGHTSGSKPRREYEEAFQESEREAWRVARFAEANLQAYQSSVRDIVRSVLTESEWSDLSGEIGELTYKHVVERANLPRY